ncbi:MAG: glutamate racemase [Alphaproteobacteria bacterium]|nr:glutamate racemase [Alphaproteobacteria bacterium]
MLVFDSGAGGMSVARQIRSLLPQLPLCYVADDAGFPYGDWPEEALSALRGTAGAACRRAAPLRRRHCLQYGLHPRAGALACAVVDPVVGTVPAIKPAAEISRSGLVTVLATPATVVRDYTFDLIRRFAPDGDHPRRSRRLALARGGGDCRQGRGPGGSGAGNRPCFVTKNGARTDVVVLACTHYPLLLPQLMQAAPWDVDWLDPAPAIAAACQCAGRGRRRYRLVPNCRSTPTG